MTTTKTTSKSSQPQETPKWTKAEIRVAEKAEEIRDLGKLKSY